MTIPSIEQLTSLYDTYCRQAVFDTNPFSLGVACGLGYALGIDFEATRAAVDGQFKEDESIG